MDQRISQVSQFLKQYQQRFCDAIAEQEQSMGGQQVFTIDDWQREEGGGGRSCVMQDGELIEKAGVMFSHINIKKLPVAATLRHPDILGAKAVALGVSIVIHPKNPWIPTSHANVRLFVAYPENAAPVWWFGGGFDLTPYYPQLEDCIRWHQNAKQMCDRFDDQIYDQHKAWCDQYFHLPHRNEQRGIGGLFFDDLNQWSFEQCFAYIQHVATTYMQSYLALINKYKAKQWTDAERDFQLYRRGRYVEYNLLYDRGTLFGLQSGGRVESILVSLPSHVQWLYNPVWPEDSAENQLTAFYLKPQDWINIKAE